MTQTQPSAFDTAIAQLMQHEGGYINDPDDPGGETKYGISARVYPDLDIKRLEMSDAIAIYRRDYWIAPKISCIDDPALAVKIFDLGVNIGTGHAARILQMAANLFGAALMVDGQIGEKTLAWVNHYRHPEALLMAVRVFAGNYYISLDRPKYLAGWLRRLGQ